MRRRSDDSLESALEHGRMKRKSKMHKIFRTAVVMAAVALALAGCGSSAKISQPVSGSWADIVAAANKRVR
ncbi:outer membrane murein-binding lipoprotein Lpp [Nocardia sp. GAS34]